jgi:hypothetical protein
MGCSSRRRVSKQTEERRLCISYANDLAAEYSDALGRTINYVDVLLEQWRDQQLHGRNLPEHVFEHLLTMARLHAANRYDRLTPRCRGDRRKACDECP